MKATGLPDLVTSESDRVDSDQQLTDAEGVQQVVCSIQFEDTVNSATSGT